MTKRKDTIYSLAKEIAQLRYDAVRIDAIGLGEAGAPWLAQTTWIDFLPEAMEFILRVRKAKE